MSVCVNSHGMSDRYLKSTSGNRANCSSHLRIFWLSILPRMSFMILSLMSARVCILSGAICCALSCSCCFMSAYLPFKPVSLCCCLFLFALGRESYRYLASISSSLLCLSGLSFFSTPLRANKYVSLRKS